MIANQKVMVSWVLACRAQYKASILVGHFCKHWFHILLLQCKCTEIWSTKVKFDWPLAKILLLFCALSMCKCIVVRELDYQLLASYVEVHIFQLSTFIYMQCLSGHIRYTTSPHVTTTTKGYLNEQGNTSGMWPTHYYIKYLQAWII